METLWLFIMGYDIKYFRVAIEEFHFEYSAASRLLLVTSF